MPIQTREYTSVKKLNANTHITAIRMAQINAIQYLEGNLTDSQFKSNVANIVAIAGVAYSIFGKTTAVGIALGVIGLVASSPTTTQRNMLISAMKNGNLAIQTLELNLISRGLSNTSIDVELAFLEAKDYHTLEHLFTGVTSVGAISAYYDSNGNKFVPTH